MFATKKSLVLVTLVAATACGDARRRNTITTTAAGTSAPATSSTPASTAKVRVLHGSPDAPPVDVLVDGQVALAKVPFRTGSSYLPVPTGERELRVNAAGTKTTVITAKLKLEKERAYTAIAVGKLAAIEPLLLEDDLEAPASGNVRLRVVHASPSAGTVDLYLTKKDQDLATARPTLAKVDFKAASAFLEIAAGEYRARLTPSGTKTIAYDSGALSLARGSILTVVALDGPGGASPVTLVALTGDTKAPALELANTTSRLRAVHASPDAPAVDVLLDGKAVLSSVAFKQFSGYLETTTGAHRLEVTPAGQRTVVIDATATLEAAQSATVIAIGKVAQIKPLVLVDDLAAPAAGKFKLRLVHAAPSAGRVDVYITGVAEDLATVKPTLAGFDFGKDTGYLEAPEGAYRVRVTLAGTKTVAIDTGALAIKAGQIRTAIAVDPEPTKSAFGAILLADAN